VVLKVEVAGRRLLAEHDDAWIVEFGAGETWHDFVAWTLDQGWPGLENLALIPGTVGAAPVQNIGAYGLELADRFTFAGRGRPGHRPQRDAGRRACAFGYRDSVFKHPAASRAAWPARADHPRAAAPARPWQPVLGYLDLERRMAETGNTCARRAHAVRLGVRHPPRQAARPGCTHRQCRQLLQEPGGQRRAVPRHHRPRPRDRALPAWPTAREAGRRLADRRLRLEGQERGPTPASTSARRWCW
jgi:UDP-N-acetylenolpyruvoylglucosamine reductase